MNIKEFDPLHDDKSSNESDLENDELADNSDEEEPLKKYKFKVYATTGELECADSEEYTSPFYSSFNEVYRALAKFERYSHWPDFHRETGTSIQLEGHEEVPLYDFPDMKYAIVVDDLPKLGVSEEEFDEIIYNIGRERQARQNYLRR